LNGAKVSEILYLLNKDILMLVIIAYIIAVPLMLYGLNRWLQSFAFRIRPGMEIFILAGVIAIGITLLTVSWQSWRAATRNPVEALRYE
jgi:putative ABC transport system permease protein